jgi:predicted DNA-binding antitoxin AbrB/MazE fold protein
MSHVVEAIYENGILRPEQPLPLTNRERVRLVVERLDRGSHSVLDIPPVSLGDVIDPLQVEHDLLGEMLEGRS